MLGRLEPAEPGVDPLLGGIEQRAQGRIIGTRRHIHRGDDGGAVVEVVEHEQGVDHHEDGIGKVAIVRRRVGERLEGARDIVAHEAHCTAGEAGRPGTWAGAWARMTSPRWVRGEG